MTSPIPLRPVSVGALLEAAERSGLPDEIIEEIISLMIARLFPESLIPSWELEREIRRAAATTGPAPRLRLVK